MVRIPTNCCSEDGIKNISVIRLSNTAPSFISDSLEKNTSLYPDSVHVHDCFIPICDKFHGSELDYLDAQS